MRGLARFEREKHGHSRGQPRDRLGAAGGSQGEHREEEQGARRPRCLRYPPVALGRQGVQEEHRGQEGGGQGEAQEGHVGARHGREGQHGRPQQVAREEQREGRCGPVAVAWQLLGLALGGARRGRARQLGGRLQGGHGRGQAVLEESELGAGETHAAAKRLGGHPLLMRAPGRGCPFRPRGVSGIPFPPALDRHLCVLFPTANGRHLCVLFPTALALERLDLVPTHDSPRRGLQLLEAHLLALVLHVLPEDDLGDLQRQVGIERADLGEDLEVRDGLQLEARHGDERELGLALAVDGAVHGGQEVLQLLAELLHVGREEPACGHGLARALRAPARLGRGAHDVLGDAHDGAHVALEFPQQKFQVLARLQHVLLVDLVVARQGEDVWLVRPWRGLELLPDLGVARPQVRGRQLREQRHAAVGARGHEGVVGEVHEGARGVLLDAHGGLELAYELGRGVPGVGVGAPDLGLAHALVVDEDVRQGGRDGGVEHAVDGHVQGGLHKDKDADVLVLDVEGRGDLDAVRDQPGVVLLDHCLRGLAGDLRVPVEGAVGEHLGDLVAVFELAYHPGDEAVDQARPDGLAAKGAVVAVQELLELVAALLPV